MTSTLLTLGLFAIVIAAVSAFAVSIYNRLINLDQQCENGFGQIEIQLKRRYDLIPNLVEAAKSYLQHESETLERVIAARNQASSSLGDATKPGAGAAEMQQWMGAEGLLSGAMGRLNFVMEDYPELKADENIAHLMEELTSTENRISFARQAFNDWCTAFNIYRCSFPNIVLANSLGFAEDRPLLEFEDSAVIQEAPKVELVSA